jgi:hypothetical protein
MKRNIFRCFFLAALIASTSVIAAAQKKNASAPAPKASAPAKAAAPAQHNTPAQHNAPGQSHTPAAAGHTSTTPGHGNTPGHSTTGNTTHGATNTGRGPGNEHGATASTGRGGNANMAHANPKTTPAGSHERQLKGGGTATVRKDGSVRSINKNGMQISHGLHGGRTVVSTHNGARVVSSGHRGGYVQRAYFSRGGRTYVSRTYVVGGVSYVGVYRSYGYGGYCCYYGYAPAYYYGPAYYGWAYNPWAAPVAYGWGWGGAPWYGYYGAYYAPYPVYPSAAFWLTDYLIAASLQSAYAAQAAESGALLFPLDPDYPLVASLGPVPLPDNAKVAMSKEVKDQIADEIKEQIAEDKDAAAKGSNNSGGQASSNETLPALDPKHKIFVVNKEVSVVADGDECSLSDGDVISRAADTPDADKNVDVKILASKPKDCAVGKQVAVALDDLQEMYNDFHKKVVDGMEELSKKQGSGGLPKSPDSGKTAGEVTAPPPDSSAAKALTDQQSAADQTEAEVKQETASGSN